MDVVAQYITTKPVTYFRCFIVTKKRPTTCAASHTFINIVWEFCNTRSLQKPDQHKSICGCHFGVEAKSRVYVYTDLTSKSILVAECGVLGVLTASEEASLLVGEALGAAAVGPEAGRRPLKSRQDIVSCAGIFEQSLHK